MALPNLITNTTPLGSDAPSTIDNQIRDLKLAVQDLLGIPNATAISVAGLNFVAAGLDRVIFQDAALNPSAAGRLQRNAANLLFHDGTAARTLVNLETAQVFSGALTFNGITTLGANVTRAADQVIDLTGAGTRTLTLQNSTGGQVTNIDVDGTLLFRNNTAFTLALSGTPTANRTITFPDATDTAVTLAASQTLTSKTLTSPVLNTGVSGTAVLDEDDMVSDSATKVATQQSIKAYVDSKSTGTLGTPVSLAAQTEIDFTGIPAGTKRVTVTFSGVSTSGTSDIILQLGDSGGIETTNYFGAVSNQAGTTSNFTSGFKVDNTVTAAQLISGSVILTLLNSTTHLWVEQSITGREDAASLNHGGGQTDLDTALTQVRITTAGGINTFDTGFLNILYES